MRFLLSVVTFFSYALHAEGGTIYQVARAGPNSYFPSLLVNIFEDIFIVEVPFNKYVLRETSRPG